MYVYTLIVCFCLPLLYLQNLHLHVLWLCLSVMKKRMRREGEETYLTLCSLSSCTATHLFLQFLQFLQLLIFSDENISNVPYGSGYEMRVHVLTWSAVLLFSGCGSSCWLWEVWVFGAVWSVGWESWYWNNVQCVVWYGNSLVCLIQEVWMFGSMVLAVWWWQYGVEELRAVSVDNMFSVVVCVGDATPCVMTLPSGITRHVEEHWINHYKILK